MNSLQTTLIEVCTKEPRNAMEAEELEYRIAYLEHVFIKAGKSSRY